MATNFSLVIQAGPNPGQRTGLALDSFVIGRDPGSDLHIQDIEVSRRHARLIAQSGGFVLEDLGSTNGTFVNGERVRTVTVLRPGDEIRLGEVVTLRYELDLNSLETTPPTPAPRAAAPRSTTPPPPTASLPSLDPPAPTPSAARNLPPQPPRTAAPAQPISQPPPRPADEPIALRMAAERNFVDPLQYDPATDVETPLAAPSARRPRRKGIRLSRNAMLGCGGLLLLGLCSMIAFLFYVDANSLWCDVFGGLIPACRPIVLP